MSSDLRYDQYQFANDHQKAASASTGISMADYDKMHTDTKATLFYGRSRSTTPIWASDLRKMGELLARYMELRADMRYPRLDTTERRIVYAQKKILAARPKFIAVLDGLSAEYVALKNGDTDRLKELAVQKAPDAAHILKNIAPVVFAPDSVPDRLRILETQIRILDAQLCVDERWSSLIVRLIHFYFRCGYNSVETANELGGVISPVGVRQIAHRLEKLWEKMQSGQDRKPTKAEVRKAKRHAHWTVALRAEQLEKEKAERDAETPEAREARLAWHRDYYQKNRDRVHAQMKIQRTLHRAERIEKYRAMTTEQIEERRRKARERRMRDPEKFRANRNAQYALRVAKRRSEQVSESV